MYFTNSTLTDGEARLIADAYFKSSKDMAKMAKILGIKSFDVKLLLNPHVKKYIIEKRVQVAELYTLEHHLQMLKKIRNGAMNDENWKVALSSEIAVGKAAGLYEGRKELTNENKVEAAKLSTADLRARLAGMNKALPSPEEMVEAAIDFIEDRDDEVDEEDLDDSL